jgi:hypothetical protein
MTKPETAFLEAMTRGPGFGKIDYDYLESCTTVFLIEQILAVKGHSPSDCYMKKHRAMALRAELDSRPDFQRPRTARETEAYEWLMSQIMRHEA